MNRSLEVTVVALIWSSKVLVSWILFLADYVKFARKLLTALRDAIEIDLSPASENEVSTPCSCSKEPEAGAFALSAKIEVVIEAVRAINL